jgi:hypothetical protein
MTVIAGLNYGYSPLHTGVALVDKLLMRGGIQNMMYTFSTFRIAISFGGEMEHVGYLRQILGVMIRKGQVFQGSGAYRNRPVRRWEPSPWERYTFPLWSTEACTGKPSGSTG